MALNADPSTNFITYETWVDKPDAASSSGLDWVEAGLTDGAGTPTASNNVYLYYARNFDGNHYAEQYDQVDPNPQTYTTYQADIQSNGAGHFSVSVGPFSGGATSFTGSGNLLQTGTEWTDPDSVIQGRSFGLGWYNSSSLHSQWYCHSGTDAHYPSWGMGDNVDPYHVWNTRYSDALLGSHDQC